MVFVEFYLNVLEYGVIGFDLMMKSDVVGFVCYYQEWVSCLQVLCDGYVWLYLDLVLYGVGGCLLVWVEDSGEGFDVECVLNVVECQECFCGRGLCLICELFDCCQWLVDGKVVFVEFFWLFQV